MPTDPVPTQSGTRWNGRGLSIWACKCGARRRVTGYTVRRDRIAKVHADPCKRCGTTDEPTTCHGDPWGDDS